MDTLELKWKNENGIICIYSDEITAKIEVDEQNKQLKNVKALFREIIFKSYYNDWKKIISFVEDEMAIPEIKEIINGLIDVCNTELKSRLSESD